MAEATCWHIPREVRPVKTSKAWILLKLNLAARIVSKGGVSVLVREGAAAICDAFFKGEQLGNQCTRGIRPSLRLQHKWHSISQQSRRAVMPALWPRVRWMLCKQNVHDQRVFPAILSWERGQIVCQRVQGKIAVLTGRARCS